MSLKCRRSIFSIVALAASMLLPIGANAASLSPHVGCLEDSLKQDRRLDVYEASACIIAWVCAEESGSDQGIKFGGCCDSAPSLVVNFETKNFLESSQTMHDIVEKRLNEESLSSEEFWASFGVLPQKAARCANAMLKVRQAQGFWEIMNAEDELKNACPTSKMAPDFIAEIKQRGY